MLSRSVSSPTESSGTPPTEADIVLLCSLGAQIGPSGLLGGRLRFYNFTHSVPLDGVMSLLMSVFLPEFDSQEKKINPTPNID